MRNRALTPLLALPALFLLTQCERCDDEQAPAPVSSQEQRPSAEPRGLVAELMVPAPERLWHPLRELFGRYQGALPLNLSVALARGLELPVELAGTLDTARPALGVVLAAGDGSPDLVLAVRVNSGRELVARLTTGRAPAYRARSSRDVTLLEPIEAGVRKPLAVFRNVLVFGTATAELEASARYLVDRVARRPSPQGLLQVSVGPGQLAGPLSNLLRSAWERHRAELLASEERARAQKSGKPPDFGEPAAVRSALDSGVDAVLALADSSRELTLELTQADKIWSLRAELMPEPRGAAHDWVSGQVMGSLDPLEQLPASAAVGLLSRSRPEQRSRGAREVAQQIAALFGARLRDQEQALVTEALQHLAAGRGDESTLALLVGPKAAVIAQGRVADAESYQAALDDVPELLSLGAVKTPLEEFLGPLRLMPITEGTGRTSVSGHALSFGRGAQFGENALTRLEMLWRIEQDRYHVALGPAPAAPFLAASIVPKPGLGELERVRLLLQRCQEASLALLLRPAALGLAPAELDPGAAVLAATGRHGKRGFMTISMPSDVLRAFLEPAAAP